MSEIVNSSDINATIDTLYMGVVVVDASLQIELINKASCDIWKLGDSQEWTGRPLAELLYHCLDKEFYDVDEMDRDAFVDAKLAEIKEDEVDQQELVRKDGKTLLYSVQKLADDRRLISHLDISNERKIATELNAVRHDKQLARTTLIEAIAALEDGFVFFDTEDRLVICNEAFRDQFADYPEVVAMLEPGVTYREMTTILAKSGMVPGIEGKEEEFVDQLVKQRRSELGLEKTFKTHDGRWIKQRDKETESGGIVGVRIDVSEVKESEDRLAKTSELLASTANSLPQGILVLENGKIKHFNPKMLELHGMDETVLKVGQDMMAFLKDHFVHSYDEETTGDPEEIYETVISGKPYIVERRTKSGKLLKVEGVAHSSGIYVITYTDLTEQKIIQDELSAREELLNSTLAASENGILVTEGYEKVVTCNEKCRRMLGFSEDELTSGGSYPKLLSLQHKRSIYKSKNKEAMDLDTFIEEAIKTSEAAKLKQKTLYLANGTIARYRVRKLDKGYLVHSYIDITAEKKREQEILESQALMGTVLNASENAFLVTDSDDNLIEFNKLFYDILHCTKEEISQCNTLNDIFAILYQKKFIKPLHKVDMPEDQFLKLAATIRKSAAKEPEILYMADGRCLRYRVRTLANGHIVHSYVDVTEEKRRETEISKARSEAERISEIQSASANAMVQGLLFFQENKLQYFNPQFLELVSAAAEQIAIGMSFDDLFECVNNLTQFEYEGRGEELKAEFASNMVEHTTYNLIRHMKNGKTLQVDVVTRDNGGVVVTYSDVTASKQREAELEKAMQEAEAAERAKSEFLANMSHEIRTPMNGVMGMAELLATTELDPKQKMFTDVIVKSGASLLTIINDILDFSKIDAGQLELDLAPFSIREAIEDVATLVSAKVAEKDLELIVRVAPDLPNTFIGDVGRFRQIITNLLGNAVKFTEKGHIYVNIDALAIEAGKVRLKCSVEDTGIGIPEEKCETIFRKFSQADTSATRKHEGTGLGLSIASSLINLMGGEIQVESEIGVGSSFFFEIELPVDTSEKQRAVVIPGDMEGARILIIDDNEVNRSILTEQMAAWRFDSASAATGQSGLEIIKAAMSNNVAIDLVVLDYQMPDMTGSEVFKTMRADPAMRDIPVIMLTSVDGVQANQKLSELGLEANLTNPARYSLLLET
ncbi:MAG: PAS-domain containing protein, partial [Pseudomonadota bacterium]